jgi:hypothetical protein
MPIREEYSLVRYDPRQGLLNPQVEGRVRPAPGRASGPSYPHENTVPASMAAGSLRQSRPHPIYSLRRTLETSAAGAVGQIVDIFV